MMLPLSLSLCERQSTIRFQAVCVQCVEKRKPHIIFFWEIYATVLTGCSIVERLHQSVLTITLGSGRQLVNPSLSLN